MHGNIMVLVTATIYGHFYGNFTATMDRSSMNLSSDGKIGDLLPRGTVDFFS
jgi:hypothetical protein